jgi:hypothetical protein
MVSFRGSRQFSARKIKYNTDTLAGFLFPVMSRLRLSEIKGASVV